MDRATEISNCVKEIEEICKKYKVELGVYDHLDYDYDETSYISGSSLVLEDEIDGQTIYWDYYGEIIVI